MDPDSLSIQHIVADKQLIKPPRTSYDRAVKPWHILPKRLTLMLMMMMMMFMLMLIVKSI
jgi:hypothetical protein